MDNTSAATRLKIIREATGLSIQKVADRMQMKASSYRHYEDRYKGNSLPAEIVDKLLVAFNDHPEVRNDILGLISLAPHVHSGMAEPGAQMRGQRLADTLYSATKAPPEITIKTDGTHVQVSASVDRQGIDKLIEKLVIARDLLD